MIKANVPKSTLLTVPMLTQVVTKTGTAGLDCLVGLSSESSSLCAYFHKVHIPTW